MIKGYHPGVDNSHSCALDNSSNYTSMIGFCIWIFVLVRLDIAFDTSAMSMFNMVPREEHLKTVIKILSYLKTFPKVRIIKTHHTLTIPYTLLIIIQIG
jgi:hypothetical protein